MMIYSSIVIVTDNTSVDASCYLNVKNEDDK